MDYFPTQTGKVIQYPEYDYFWATLLTLMPDQVQNYINQIEEERRPKANLQDQKFACDIDDEYIDELLKYDFVSKKKGRGCSSLLISRKNKRVRAPPPGDAAAPPPTGHLEAPPGCMDVRRWYESLTPAQQRDHREGQEMKKRIQALAQNKQLN